MNQVTLTFVLTNVQVCYLCLSLSKVAISFFHNAFTTASYSENEIKQMRKNYYLLLLLLNLCLLVNMRIIGIEWVVKIDPHDNRADKIAMWTNKLSWQPFLPIKLKQKYENLLFPLAKANHLHQTSWSPIHEETFLNLCSILLAKNHH